MLAQWLIGEIPMNMRAPLGGGADRMPNIADVLIGVAQPLEMDFGKYVLFRKLLHRRDVLTSPGPSPGG